MEGTVRPHARGVAGEAMSEALDEACAAMMGSALPFSTTWDALLLVEYAAPLVGHLAREVGETYPFSLEWDTRGWLARIGRSWWLDEEPSIAICGAFLVAMGMSVDDVIPVVNQDQRGEP